jgi:hypothetical protein
MVCNSSQNSSHKRNKSLNIQSYKENVFLYNDCVNFTSDKFKTEKLFKNNMIDTDTSDDIIGYDINEHNNEADTVVKQRPNSLGSKLYQKRLQLKSYKNDDKPKQEELGYDIQFFDRKHDLKHLAATQTFINYNGKV